MTVIIIVNEAEWVKGQKCFDARVGTQSIPQNHFVCGMVMSNEEIIDRPHCNKVQSDQFAEVMRYASDLANDRWTTDSEYNI